MSQLSAPPSAPAVTEPVFLARQPIFDRGGRVRGYEMLFRDGIERALRGRAPSPPTPAEVERLTGFDWHTLTRGRDAWINCTREVLLEGWYGLLPPAETVVELLEHVEPDDSVVLACQRLKEAGYRLALDDFWWRPEMEPLVELADIVKVDVLASNDAEVQELIERLARENRTLLAEKVETHAMWRRARDLGYDLFQGFFYRSPEASAGEPLPRPDAAWLAWLREAMRPGSDSQRLLGDLPEPAPHPALQGDRRSALILAVERLACHHPRELLRTGLVRARMGERLAPEGDGLRDARFTVGLLSILDAALDRPLREVAAELDLTPDLQAALTGRQGPLGVSLTAVLAYENTDWPALARACGAVGVPESRALLAYRDALAWSEAALRVVSPGSEPPSC